MKKFFLGLAITAGTLSFAQEKPASSASPVRFGLKAGLNVSNLNDNDSKAKAGFYGVQPELLYNGLGAKDQTYSSLKLNLDYISVPVMVQYNILPALYVEAGPQFSFAISQKVKGDGGSADVNEVFKNFDLGLGLGAGYYFEQRFGITARYVAGLTDIVENNPGDAVRNGAFQIGVAYKF